MSTKLLPLLTLGVTIVGASLACSIEEIETEIDCAEYCRQASECDDDVDREECRNDCEDTLNDCMEDEREEAQDKLDECSQSSCDDFTGCTIEAGAQCFFGL